MKIQNEIIGTEGGGVQKLIILTRGENKLNTANLLSR